MPGWGELLQYGASFALVIGLLGAWGNIGAGLG